MEYCTSVDSNEPLVGVTSCISLRVSCWHLRNLSKSQGAVITSAAEFPPPPKLDEYCAFVNNTPEMSGHKNILMIIRLLLFELVSFADEIFVWI